MKPDREADRGLEMKGPSELYEESSDEMKLAFCRVVEQHCKGGSIVGYTGPATPDLSDRTTAKSVRELLEEVDEESELAKVGIAMFEAGAEWIEIIWKGEDDIRVTDHFSYPLEDRGRSTGHQLELRHERISRSFQLQFEQTEDLVSDLVSEDEFVLGDEVRAMPDGVPVSEASGDLRENLIEAGKQYLREEVLEDEDG